MVRIPKQPNRSTLEKKLDKIVSEMVRERDNWTCQRCHTRYTPKNNALHCSHYYSRRYRGTRWDMNNLIALCYGCHKMVEGDKQGWYTDYMRELLGDEVFEMLRIKAYAVTKFSVQDLELMLAQFKVDRSNRLYQL